MKIFLFLTLMLTLFIPFYFHAEETPEHNLKSIMQGLGQSMNELNDGIFLEDFQKIEQAAIKIANHPKPKSQLPVVIKTLKFRMSKFKSLDNNVHDAATDIARMAKEKDLQSILKKHKVMLDNCVACHMEFREEISNALRKQP